MKKITKRMIQYVFLINLIVIILGFLLTGVLLPKIYNNNEFNELEKTSEYVIEALSENKAVELANISVVLLSDGYINGMCGVEKGHKKNIDFSKLEGKEIYKSKNGHTFITYKRDTKYGDLVVYKSYEGSESLIKSVNKLLIAIFMLSLIFSIVLAIYLGNIFTKPIIMIQKRAMNIAKGKYDDECIVSTRDEIEYLSNSIEEMAGSLAKKDKMQKEFIANVSHDLKTPLSVIRANGEVIKDGLVKGEDAIEFSENIIKEVDKLNDLVNEILSLSKLQDNKNIIVKKEVSLKKFIDESYIKLSSSKSLNNDIEFDVISEIENIDKIYVEIDEGYLFRVLSNIFNNAVVHSQSKKIIFSVKEFKDGIKICIKDYGKGIDKEDLEFIWERYYKDDLSGGMGLGLAISKEILVAHGFKYGVESEKNKGTEFYFTVSSQITH